MKQYFSVGVREVHISHRIVWIEDKDHMVLLPRFELEQRAISKAHAGGMDNETFLEYSHTMSSDNSDIRAAEPNEIDDT
jgi:hypothetical protein